MEASRNKPEQAQTKTSRFQHMQCAQIFVVSKYGRLSAMFFKIGELSASTRRGTSAEGFGLVSLVSLWNVRFAFFFRGYLLLQLLILLLPLLLRLPSLSLLLFTSYYLLFTIYYLLLTICYLLCTIY